MIGKIYDVVLYVIIIVCVFLLLKGVVYAGEPILPLIEHRYCYTDLTKIPRDADGTIHRSLKMIAAFKQQHPCPSTKKKTGACKGWAIDHVIPLAVGGCDAVWNAQWLPDAIKSCAQQTCKDRFERIIYAPTYAI